MCIGRISPGNCIFEKENDKFWNKAAKNSLCGYKNKKNESSVRSKNTFFSIFS
jgi:hypothetical protein